MKFISGFYAGAVTVIAIVFIASGYAAYQREHSEDAGSQSSDDGSLQNQILNMMSQVEHAEHAEHAAATANARASQAAANIPIRPFRG